MEKSIYNEISLQTKQNEASKANGFSVTDARRGKRNRRRLMLNQTVCWSRQSSTRSSSSEGNIDSNQNVSTEIDKRFESAEGTLTATGVAVFRRLKSIITVVHLSSTDEGSLKLFDHHFHSTKLLI